MKSLYFLLFGCVSAWFGGGDVNYTPHSAEDEHDVDDEDFLNITETQGFPNPQIFIQEYVDHKRVVVMKGGMIDSPAYRLWNDDTYFTTGRGTDGHDKLKTDYFKTGGHYDYFINDVHTEDATFAEFVNNYKEKNYTIATLLPDYLLNDVAFPCGLQCDEFLLNTVYHPVLWMSNGKLSTKVHTDVGDNIICSLRGRLNFTLYENKDRQKLRLVKGYNTISDVNSPTHNFGSDVKTRKVNISRGDCFYIPSNTSYSVWSNDNSIALSLMWKKICHHVIKMDNCNTNCKDSKYRLGDVRFHSFDDTMGQVNAIKRLVIRSYEDLEGMLEHTANFDLKTHDDGKMILTYAGVVFAILDRDGDKTISDEEIAKTSIQDWLEYGEKNQGLASLLKHFKLIHEKKPTPKHIEL